MIRSTKTPSIFAEHPCGNHDNVQKNSLFPTQRIPVAAMLTSTQTHSFGGSGGRILAGCFYRFCPGGGGVAASCFNRFLPDVFLAKAARAFLQRSRTGVCAQSEKTPPYTCLTYGHVFLPKLPYLPKLALRSHNAVKYNTFGFWECGKTQGGRSATYLVSPIL